MTALTIEIDISPWLDEEGLNRIDAAKKGIGEIAFPIIISTATGCRFRH